MAYNVFTSSRRSNGASGGFALVAVLMLAVLLTLVVVALFSLLNVETQSGGNVALRNQARQNALTGLDLALGELQKQMGPDKKISASAAFLDSNTATPEIDGVAQPNWIGAWNSNLWTTTDQIAGTVPTYTKTTNFQGWLVSVPKDGSINSKNLNLPVSPAFTTANSVTLVGSGTVKPKTSELVEVKAWKVDGDLDSAGNLGHYAWWVGDEGMKAKVNYAAPDQTAIATPSLKQVMDQANLLKTAPRSALEAAALYVNLKPQATADYAKAITFPSLSLAFKDSSTPGDFTKAFHDYTVYSKGVLSDVQYGGLKKDLNLLLELPKTNLPLFVRTPGAGYQQVYTYKLAASSTTPATSNQNLGPDWGLIYRYYNLYKSPYLEYNDSGPNLGFVFNMDQYNYNIALASDVVTGNPALDGAHDFILPQTLRVQYLFGFYQGPIKPGERQYFLPVTVPAPTSTNPNATKTLYKADPAHPIPPGDVLYIVVYPTLQLWNPYNIRLRSSNATEYGTSDLPDPIQGRYSKNVYSMPSPPLTISVNGEGFRPFIDTSGASTSSIFQSFGGSMCTTWIMSSGGPSFYQLYMDPGAIRLFGIGNYTDTYNQQMYWQDQVDTTSSSVVAGDTLYNGSSPKRAFDLLDTWNSSNIPPHSDLLSPDPTKDNHVAATSTVSYQVKWTLDNNFKLQKNALGRALFNEGDNVQRLPGVIELNNYNGRQSFPTDLTTYQTLTSGVNALSVTPSTILNVPSMAFAFTINCKVFPKDNIRKSRALLFTDPTEKNYLILGGDSTTAQMAPFEETLQAIKGDASGPITNYPSGTRTVQVDSTGQRGYFGDTSDGINSIVALEFPVLPMSSLTQLQNVALGRDYTHPMYKVSNFYSGVNTVNTQAKWDRVGASFFHAFGNSYAHPAISQNVIAQSKVSGAPGQNFIRSFDHSFYANNTFWDSYFLSGITPQASIAFTKTGTVRTVTKVLQDFLSTDPTVYKALPSSRLLSWIPQNKTATDVVNDLITTPTTIKDKAFGRSAAWLMVDGAFNINSTSVDAWTAVLAGNQGQKVPYLETTTASGVHTESTALFKVANTPLTDIPYLRLNIPNNIAASIGTPQTYWNGYRKLSTTEIRTLATKIVEQVKLRGPFLSLAEFVNRQVSTNTNLSSAGALQTAIDNAGLNGDLSLPAVVAADLTSNNPPFANTTAAVGPMAAGGPNYLTQADILTPIAGIVSARSDTFTIRSYGEITSRAGKVISRAWCEAVVQRTPEYMDQTDPALTTAVDPTAGVNAGNALAPYNYATTPPTAIVNSINATLGRRFRIVQFRWLNPDEV